jgi:hypothetical protein
MINECVDIEELESIEMIVVLDISWHRLYQKSEGGGQPSYAQPLHILVLRMTRRSRMTEDY